MRFVHTSDWHFGRRFKGHALLADQAAFVDALVTFVGDERIDLVVIAGDLWDRAVPPPDAVALLFEALRRLRDAGANVAAIAGNHDAAPRLDGLEPVLDPSLLLRAGRDRAGQPVRWEFADGPVDLIPVPFLEPSTNRGEASQSDVVGPVLGSVDRAVLVPRSLVMAHAFVNGGASSESERPLSIGGTELVPASLFDGFGYVALGHLHRPQAVGERLRYSGSPLAYSFSEDHAKSVTVGDWSADGSLQLDAVSLGVGRAVRTIRDSLDGVLTASRWADAETAWVRVELTDAVPSAGAMDRVQQRFPHTVELSWVARVAGGSTRSVTAAEAATLEPVDLVGRFWAEATGEAWDAADEAVMIDALRAVGLDSE
jgi:DNA repair protein SbcD/Mre11